MKRKQTLRALVRERGTGNFLRRCRLTAEAKEDQTEPKKSAERNERRQQAEALAAQAEVDAEEGDVRVLVKTAERAAPAARPKTQTARRCDANTGTNALAYSLESTEGQLDLQLAREIPSYKTSHGDQDPCQRQEGGAGAEAWKLMCQALVPAVHPESELRAGQGFPSDQAQLRFADWANQNKKQCMTR